MVWMDKPGHSSPSVVGSVRLVCRAVGRTGAFVGGSVATKYLRYPCTRLIESVMAASLETVDKGCSILLDRLYRVYTIHKRKIAFAINSQPDTIYRHLHAVVYVFAVAKRQRNGRYTTSVLRPVPALRQLPLMSMQTDLRLERDGHLRLFGLAASADLRPQQTNRPARLLVSAMFFGFDESGPNTNRGACPDMSGLPLAQKKLGYDLV